MFALSLIHFIFLQNSSRIDRKFRLTKLLVRYHEHTDLEKVERLFKACPCITNLTFIITTSIKRQLSLLIGVCILHLSVYSPTYINMFYITVSHSNETYICPTFFSDLHIREFCPNCSKVTTRNFHGAAPNIPSPPVNNLSVPKGRAIYTCIKQHKIS